MTNPSSEYKNRDILSTEEIDEMIKSAETLKIEYYQLRAKCLISIAKKFGKRRIEIARLRRPDIKQVGEDLQFSFTIAKKHKKGLFQFLKECKKLDPQVLELPLPEIKKLHAQWQETEGGHRYTSETALQSMSTQDKYVKYITEYIDFLARNYPTAQYLFPSGVELFGSGDYIVYDDKHLSGSQLLRIIKPLAPTAWLHLFRETKGAEVAKLFGRTITSVTEVKETLDLEEESTAYRYVRRYSAKKQAVET